MLFKENQQKTQYLVYEISEFAEKFSASNPQIFLIMLDFFFELHLYL